MLFRVVEQAGWPQPSLPHEPISVPLTLILPFEVLAFPIFETAVANMQTGPTPVASLWLVVVTSSYAMLPHQLDWYAQPLF
jgi:hypothetical protein